MDIPNLSAQPIKNDTSTNSFSFPIISVIIIISLVAGYFISRISPTVKSKTPTSSSPATTAVNSTDSISAADQLKTGTIYGSNDPNCKDTATGSVEKGSINGEGTHILNRPGGADQRASLTSSTVDLDLFVGKTVSITGQTNASKKTGWLLDVCSIKISQQ